MSIVPLLLNDSLELLRPSRILNQRFGLGLEPEDLLAPMNFPLNSRLGLSARSPNYYRQWSCRAATGDTGSCVQMDSNKFQVNLDVQQFAPNEIAVKVIGNNAVVIEGKHEEKQDEHGFISRHFIRKYILPDGHDINNVVCNLSSDGVLNITAPRVDQTAEHRKIPIEQTGIPSKPIPKSQDEVLACPKKE